MIIASDRCAKKKEPRKKFSWKNVKKFGTSKLEQDFATNFLDKLGVDYIWQYEAKDIGRFFDYKIVNGPIIEIQGSYWHGDKRLYEEKDLNETQKKNIMVDELKRKWALMHSIPIYYFWEKDIRENPSKVMDDLKKILRIKRDNNKTRKKFHGSKKS